MKTVNFRLLNFNNYLNLLETADNLHDNIYGEGDTACSQELDKVTEEIGKVEQNFKLFFRALAAKSTFAHLAHKELKNLRPDIDYSTLAQIAEELYPIFNPTATKDIPQYFYYKIETAWYRWNDEQSELSFKKWCIAELKNTTNES